MEEHRVLAFPEVCSPGIRDSSFLVLWVLAEKVALGLDPWEASKGGVGAVAEDVDRAGWWAGSTHM